MPYAPGWTYAYSDALGMRYATRTTGGCLELMTEDKVRYSAAEIALLSSHGTEIDKATHFVKKVFTGEIVEVGPVQACGSVTEKKIEKPQRTEKPVDAGPELW
jgi:hypothetical protein